MIYTVTLNPAIDNTIILNKLRQGQVNRSKQSLMDVGGKGLNVSKAIKAIGGESRVLGFLGRDNSNYFTMYLDKMGIKHDFNLVDGETRTNIKLVELGNGIHTDINQRGFTVISGDVEGLLKKLSGMVQKDDLVILSGSLPCGAEDDTYFRLIELIKSNGGVAILDAEGEALRKGLLAKPNIVKQNIEELSGLYSFDTGNLREIVDAASKMISKGVEIAVVSIGNKGAIYVSSKEVLISGAIEVPVKSTVGAGDSMVAGIAWGILKGMSAEETFKLAVACGTAKVIVEGTKPPSRDAIDNNLNQITIKKLIDWN